MRLLDCEKSPQLLTELRRERRASTANEKKWKGCEGVVGKLPPSFLKNKYDERVNAMRTISRLRLSKCCCYYETRGNEKGKLEQHLESPAAESISQKVSDNYK